MLTSDYLADWAFSCQHTLQNVVQSRFPNETHRWPLLKDFNAEGYVWKEQFLIIILRDKLSGIPAMGSPKVLDDSDAPSELTSENVEEWQTYMIKKFSVKPQDFVIIIPIKEGKTIEERWSKFDDAEKSLWHEQISINVTRQFYYLKGFETKEDFFIPPGYLHLVDECQQFLTDYPEYAKNVFIMMKFDNDNAKLKELEDEIRAVLVSHNLTPLRADDKVYSQDRDLWNNVCIYMICSKYGISVVEDYSKQEYNPNVSIEYGFMRALNKRVLLLADKDFPKHAADVVGKLREPFDSGDIRNSVKQAVEKWIKEIGFD